MQLPDRFRLSTTPTADPAAIVQGEHFRITVLTSRLVRLEYSPTGQFEDRATQLALNRSFEVPDFQVLDDPEQLEIHTEHFHLIYDRGPFSASGLSVQVKGNISNYHSIWRFGTPPDSFGGLPSNLGGTARTLDGVDGPVPLEPGLMNAHGYAEVDDSARLALTDDGWVAPRIEGNTDVYVFCHGRDFPAALADFYALAGPQPLLPRYALGNWWSRYYPYSEQTYTDLFDRFAEENLPFSVAVIDMDWHRVGDVDPKYGSGWTGYSWNRELFPDPDRFCTDLHERGLAITLNLHPADGIRAFEDSYPAMATAMGIDPASELPVNFDITSPTFLAHYFDHVLHPLEEQGVDFWWIDWQSGGTSRVPGLDPLWMLNHYHFLDSSWRGRRPLTFSRWAGLGSHRYPVGFSGDAAITWDSLHFQPYFTATAANVGYGWWSHDIGGHMWGYHDEELQARWYQFGTFSPINRLHTSAGPFYGREPWRYNAVVEKVMGDHLRFRHRMVPWLYTMNERAHREGRPIVEPLYYSDPGREEAYRSRDAYRFGESLLVAPITRPGDPRLGLGHTTSWIPEGTWIDLFTGLVYDGAREQTFYRDIESIPVLAREGTILPLTGPDDLSIDNPETLELRVFGAAPGEFTLYEDDGAADPATVRTRFSYDPDARSFTIHPAEGDSAAENYSTILPASREYTVAFHGLAPLTAEGGGWDEARGVLTVTVQVAAGQSATIALDERPRLAGNDVTARAFAFLDKAGIDFRTKDRAYAAVTDNPTPARAVSSLQSLELEPDVFGALAEILLARDPGRVTG